MEIENIINYWKENVSSKEKEIINSYSKEELYDSFYKQLEFGTAGLRGKIGLGTNKLNKYIIRHVSLGFGKYILNNSEGQAKIVIAHDNRQGSIEFTKEAASVFASLNIKVYVFEALRPTPELSYAVRSLHCDGGVMITASHNPKEYNGYKVYDKYGCQLTPDLISDVIKEINNIDNIFAIETKSYDEYIETNDIEVIGKEMDEEYLSKVKEIRVNDLTSIDKQKLKIVFTPLHGTASTILPKFLINEGYDISVVREQMIDDPLFSTVPYPNPEEATAFDLAIREGLKTNADLLIATDPDADRIGVAVFNGVDYTLLTGNQTGAIILDYLCKFKAHNQNSQVYNTIVTSEIASLICKKYNVVLNKTLTGFKYIGEQMRLIENTDKNFLFGYEESYGYVLKDFVRDKDAIQAAYIISEIASYYMSHENKNLIQVLDDLYKEYGYFYDKTISIVKDSAEGIKEISEMMSRLRKNKLSHIGDKEISRIEDYEEQLAYEKDKEEVLPLPKSNVIKYIFNGGWIVVRPSGTEPKIKIYYSIYESTKEETLAVADKLTKEMQKILM